MRLPLLSKAPCYAKQKRTQRQKLLENAGVDTSKLTKMDALDAALCALTAHHFAHGNFKCYGGATSGFIVIPDSPLAHD